MKKLLVITLTITLLSYSANAQSSKHKGKKTEDITEVTGTEYIPVEGKSETGVPAALQGKWVLVSGLQVVKRTDTEAGFESKKQAAGTETRRDSTTATETINGVTHTITEVEIDRAATPEKRVTPGQSAKMHTPEKPGISFYGLNETFSGFTGCNKYSGRYTINGNKITLNTAAPSTKMVCMGGYDEKAFLNALKKVNSFRTNNGNLELMIGEEVLLVFAKK